MKFALIASSALVSIAFGTPVHAAPAGTLLFTQPGAQILDATGTARPALRGGVLQDGERLLTPPGAISQIKLPDGSLIGMRPDSEVRLTAPPVANASVPLGVVLVHGAARVIGVELMDDKKVSNFRFQSGPAVLQLKGADLESAVILPTGGGGKPAPGENGPGSYQRLLVGSASVGNGATADALVPRQVSFVGAANAAPVAMATVSPNLFAANRGLNAPPMTAATTMKDGDALAPMKLRLAAALPPAGLAPAAGAMPKPPLPTEAIVTGISQPPVLVAPPILAMPKPVFAPPPAVILTQPIYIPPPPLLTIQPVTLVPPPLIPKTCTRFIGTTCVG